MDFVRTSSAPENCQSSSEQSVFALLLSLWGFIRTRAVPSPFFKKGFFVSTTRNGSSRSFPQSTGPKSFWAIMTSIYEQDFDRNKFVRPSSSRNAHTHRFDCGSLIIITVSSVVICRYDESGYSISLQVFSIVYQNAEHRLNSDFTLRLWGGQWNVPRVLSLLSPLSNPSFNRTLARRFFTCWRTVTKLWSRSIIGVRKLKIIYAPNAEMNHEMMKTESTVRKRNSDTSDSSCQKCQCRRRIYIPYSKPAT